MWPCFLTENTLLLKFNKSKEHGLPQKILRIKGQCFLYQKAVQKATIRICGWEHKYAGLVVFYHSQLFSNYEISMKCYEIVDYLHL